MSNKTQIKSANLRKTAINSALTLSAQRGWARVTMEDIATHSQIPLKDLQEEFADRNDILAAFGRQIDRRVLDNLGTEPPANTTPRDRLFDLLMERFDILNENRDGICGFIDSLRPNPQQVIIGFPHLCRSMAKMLTAAGLDATGLRGTARTLGLTILYVKTARIWREDESPDMSKTMATLDKYLERAELWGERLS